jgi:hypothetical protein
MRNYSVRADVGQRVHIPGLEVDAVVLSILINLQGVQYEVAWFANGDRNTAYVFDHELRFQ